MKPILVMAALIAALYSTVLATSTPQSPQDTLKVSVELVNVPLSVTDRRGRFVPSLTAKDFLVEEDGRRQEITNFARENELPLTLALLVDTSPSVRPVFDEEKLTAVGFLESVLQAKKDEALVIGFDRTVTLVQDFTDNIRELKRAIDDLRIGSGTSVYDAVYLASDEKLSQETGRKAIILISDGEDTQSQLRFNTALMAAQKSDAVIYGISNSTRSFFSIGRRGQGQGGFGGDINTLKKFSEETGGTTFVATDQNGFRKIFDQIAQELRSQYNIGYYSTNTARDGRFRQIKVIPRDSGYTIKARKGYYAPKSTDTR